MKFPNFVKYEKVDDLRWRDIAEFWRVGYDISMKGDVMITYNSICKKLGFDVMSYNPEVKGTEYEENKNPFDLLSIDELDFIIIYAKKHSKGDIRDRKAIKQIIERELATVNRYEIIEGKKCFKTSSNGYIRLDTLGDDYNCIVIEFAENRKEAMNNRFEDGDLLYIDDLGIKEMIDIVAMQIKDD